MITRKPVNLTLDENVIRKAKNFLAKRGTSVSDLVNYLLEVHLEENKRRKVKPSGSRPFGLTPSYELYEVPIYED